MIKTTLEMKITFKNRFYFFSFFLKKNRDSHSHIDYNSNRCKHIKHLNKIF